jgi:hypothetical protein
MRIISDKNADKRGKIPKTGRGKAIVVLLINLGWRGFRVARDTSL